VYGSDAEATMRRGAHLVALLEGHVTSEDCRCVGQRQRLGARRDRAHQIEHALLKKLRLKVANDSNLYSTGVRYGYRGFL
jgi:hypothetical protein